MREFYRCLEKGKIVRVPVSPEMIAKEIEAAEFDLARAKASCEANDSKWASVQAYYSMFHSVKAMVLHRGFREKSHYCLMVALRALYILPGLVESGILEDLDMCMALRHEADYGLVHDTQSAEICIEAAERTYHCACEIIEEYGLGTGPG